MFLRKYLFIGLLAPALIFLSFSTSSAKELTNRLGVGYKNQFSTDLPSVAAQYYPNPDLSLSASLGLDTKKDESKFGLLIRINRIIFKEDNLNFYMGAGAGLLSYEQVNADNESGFVLQGFVGSEYFFTGLDSLGFTFETGVGVTSVSSGVRFQTMADSPLRAGIIFYF